MELIDITLDKINADPNQPRKIFDDKALLDLKESIKLVGLINPITVRKDTSDNEKYFIVAGERRFRAIQEMLEEEPTNTVYAEKYKTLKVILIDDNYEEIALIENAQRQDLEWIELAEALAKLKVEKNINQTDLGIIVGRSKGNISEILSIAELPEEIRAEAKEKKGVSQWVLLETAKQRTLKAKKKKWDKLKDSGLTQAQVRKKKSSDKSKKNVFNCKDTLRLIKGLSTHIKELNLDEIKHANESEKEKLIAELNFLQNRINYLFNNRKTWYYTGKNAKLERIAPEEANNAVPQEQPNNTDIQSDNNTTAEPQENT